MYMDAGFSREAGDEKQGNIRRREETGGALEEGAFFPGILSLPMLGGDDIC